MPLTKNNFNMPRQSTSHQPENMPAIRKKLSCKSPMLDEFKGLINIHRRILFWHGYLQVDPKHDLKFYLNGFHTRIQDFISSHLKFIFYLRGKYLWFMIIINVLHIVVINPVGVYVYSQDKQNFIDNVFIMNLRISMVINVTVPLCQKELLTNVIFAMENLGEHLYIYNEDLLKKLRFVFKLMMIFVKFMNCILWPIAVIGYIHYCLMYCLPNRILWYRGWYPFDIKSSPNLEIMLTLSVMEVFLSAGNACILAPTLVFILLMIVLQFTIVKQNTEIICTIASENCSSRSRNRQVFGEETNPNAMLLPSSFPLRGVPQGSRDRTGVGLSECFQVENVKGLPTIGEANPTNRTLAHGSEEFECHRVVGLSQVAEGTAIKITQVHGNIECSDEHHIITVIADDQGGSSEELTPQETNANTARSQRNRFRLLNQIKRRNRRDVQNSDTEYMDVLEKLLISHVQQHSFLIRMVMQINTYLRFVFLYTFFYNVVVFTTLFMVMQIETMPISKKLQYIYLCVQALGLLLVTCIMGDIIMDQSEGMGEALYFSEWVEASPRYKKTMLMGMLQANKPVVLKAQGFNPFSHKFFGEVTDWMYKLITNVSNFITINN